MARHGFSGSKNDLKIFVLYILKICGGAVTMEEMQTIALIDDSIDYFQLVDALSALTKSQMVTEDDWMFSLNERALEHLQAVERELPASLRKAAAEAAKPTILRIKYGPEGAEEFRGTILFGDNP